MNTLAWVIGILFAILLFGAVIGMILVGIEWIIDIRHKVNHE